MSSEFRISAIIPTYNRAGQVAKAIESALQQSYPPIEVIVADDGSTDDTATVVQGIGSSVRLISNPNRGKAATLNSAVKSAIGDWIAVLDDDDTWRADKFIWQTKALNKYSNCRVCFSNSSYVNHPAGTPDSFAKVQLQHAESIGILEDSTNFVLRPPHGIFIQSCLISKQTLFETGGFDEQLRAADDTDMIFRLSLLSPFCYVNLPLTRIDRTLGRSHGLTDARRTRPEVYFRDQEIMYEKWLELADRLDRPARGIIRRRYADVHNAWANLHLARGEYKEAINRFQTAQTIDPRRNFRIKLFLAQIAPSLLRLRLKQS